MKLWNRNGKSRKAERYFLGAVIAVLAVFPGCGKGGNKADVTPALTKAPAGTEAPAATEGPGTIQTPAATEAPDAADPSAPTQVTQEEQREAYLSRVLDGLSLEEKVGQMFLVRCPENAIEGITGYAVGGYVLFKRDFEGETKASLTKKLEAYQEASVLPMLFAVDEEGGTVVRVSAFSEFRATPFRSPQEVFANGGLKAVAADAKEKAELLLSLGISVNLAPVCDVSELPAAYMYQRSFGRNAEETSDYVKTAVTAMKEAGLGCVLKHFPGYGNNADTHKGIVQDTRSYETYKASDFKPFLAGIEAGAGAVMVSHNIVQCMDAGLPASISGNVHRILREELGFDGVILTDDLYMDAIGEFTGEEAAAVTAVLAGNDMLCCTNFTVQIPAVIAAVKDGRISEEQIDAAVLRILRWKAELGVLRF